MAVALAVWLEPEWSVDTLFQLKICKIHDYTRNRQRSRSTLDLVGGTNWLGTQSDCRMEAGLDWMGYTWIPNAICRTHGYIHNHQRSRNTSDVGDGMSWKGKRNDWSKRKRCVYPNKVYEISNVSKLETGCITNRMESLPELQILLPLQKKQQRQHKWRG